MLYLPLARGKRFFLEFLPPPPIGSSRLEVSAVPYLGYKGGNKENHYHIVPQVPRSLDSLLSSSTFHSLPLFVCCVDPGCFVVIRGICK